MSSVKKSADSCCIDVHKLVSFLKKQKSVLNALQYESLPIKAYFFRTGCMLLFIHVLTLFQGTAHAVFPVSGIAQVINSLLIFQIS